MESAGGKQFVEITVGSYEAAPFFRLCSCCANRPFSRKLLAQIAAELFPEFIRLPFTGVGYQD